MTSNTELIDVKNKLADVLLRSGSGNQVGVGVNQKEDTIRIYLRQESEKGIQHVQNLIGGKKVDSYDVEYIQTGHLQALQCPYSRTEYSRPICGGCSIGHSKITAGTAGTVVYDVTTGKRGVLTNNHVAAASSSDIYHNASIGDQIFSPGCYDTGGCLYPIGTLERYIPFSEYSWNFVDCALVSPDSDTDVSDEVIGVGIVEYHKEPAENQYVIKSGRTSGVTYGQIIDINASMEVDYSGRILRFDNCIVTNAIGTNGDSGSILNDSSDNKAVGLLFAGSDQITIHNRISYVLSALNVKMSLKDTPSTIYVPQTSPDIVSGISSFMPVVIGITGITMAASVINKNPMD